jgi:hypothetical protein
MTRSVEGEGDRVGTRPSRAARTPPSVRRPNPATLTSRCALPNHGKSLLRNHPPNLLAILSGPI